MMGFNKHSCLIGLPTGGVGWGGQPTSLAPPVNSNKGGFDWSPSDITNAISGSGQALGGILSGIGSLIGGVNSNKDSIQNSTNNNNGQLIPQNATKQGANKNLWWVIGGGVLLLGLVVALVVKRK